MSLLKKSEMFLFGKNIFEEPKLEPPPIKLGTLDNYDDIARYERMDRVLRLMEFSKTKRRKKEMSIESLITKTQDESDFISDKGDYMANLFRNKNVAYGDSFGKTFQKYGPIAALTRMSDKWNRIEALILGAENNVPDEKLEDTLLDMANYCLMTMYELQHSSQKKHSV